MSHSRVTSAFAQSSDGNSVTTTATDTSGSGIILLFAATFAGSGTVSDSEGNTWNALTEYGSGADATGRWYWCHDPVTSATHTFTLSATGKSPSMAVVAYTGSFDATSFVMENGTGLSMGTVTTIQPGTLTPDDDDQIIVSGTSGYSGDPSAIDSGFTLIGSGPAAGGVKMSCGAGDLLQGTAANVNPTHTYGSASTCCAAGAVFKEVAGGGVTVTPDTASLTLTAFAPTVTTPRLVTPGAASLSLSTFAPTIVTPRLVTPDTASLTLSTFVPNVTGGEGLTLVPGPASLALSTFAPTVVAPRLVTPGVAALSLNTFAPTVSTPNLVTPDTATLTLLAFAPAVSATENVTITPTTTALVLTTFAPSVTGPIFTPGPYYFVALGTSAPGPVALGTIPE